MQVLEGPEAAVKQTFDQISRRPEHHGIMVLIEEHTTERQFTDWSMAFPDLDRTEGQNVPGYSEFLNTPLNGDLYARDIPKSKRLLLLFKQDAP